MKHLLAAACAWLALLAVAHPSVAADTYRIDYTITLKANEPRADVSIAVGRGGLLRALDFEIKPTRHHDLAVSAGTLTRDGNRARWVIPASGGTLTLASTIPHQRRGDGYDAIATDRFALFRGDDLVPAASARVRKGALSEAHLRFVVPANWSVETGWPRARDGSFTIDNRERGFDRPVGWMLAGDLGVRRDVIGDTRVAVAAPVGSGLRRMDVLTFMNFVWPEIERAFADTPPKILLVGAGEPMWRGGLSAPNSVFLHAERPLVSENGTSTLIHELVHVVTRIRGTDGDDWIAEGLAEFYAIELMRRAGGLGETRYRDVREWLVAFSRDVRSLKARRASSEVTARAVLLFQALDDEIERATDGAKNLDDVTRALMKKREVSLDDLRRAADAAAGRKVRSLDTPLLR